MDLVRTTPSATCTLAFLTDYELEVKPALTALARILEMLVDTQEMPPRFIHSAKRVLLCYQLTSRRDIAGG